MASVQYAFVTSTTAPYHRMLKFIDGAPVVDGTFPQQTSPIPLHKSAFSPDGLYLVAAQVGVATTTPFRMWNFDTASQTWKVVDAGALPSAGTISAIIFVNDTDIIASDSGASSAAGIWLGTLNRGTNTVTWTILDSSLKVYTHVHKLGPSGLKFGANRGGATAGAVYRGFTKQTGTWAIFSTPSAPGTPANFTAFGEGTSDLWTFRTAPTATLGVDFRGFNEATNQILDSGQVSIPTGETGRMSTMGTATAYSCAAFSPSGRRLLYSHNEAPYLRGIITSNVRTRPHWFVFADKFDTPGFPAILNDIKFMSEYFLLAAVNSSTVASGRVRGFVHTNDNEKLTEDTRISSLFSDWNAIPTSIAIGAVFTSTSTLSIYNSALEAILKDTINLANLKILLVNASAVFSATHTTLTQAVGANEVYGSSWPQGGIACDAGSYFKGLNGSDTFMVVPIPAKPLASPGSFTFRSAIIYDDADVNKKPLAFLNLGADQTVAQLDSLQFAGPGNSLLNFKTVNP